MTLARRRGPVRVFRVKHRLRVEVKGALAQILVTGATFDGLSIEKFLLKHLLPGGDR